MKSKFVSFLLLLVLAFGMLPPVTQAQAKTETVAVSDKDVSPAGMLNADGTLALDGSFSGTLALEGYSVQLDPSRGPVFGPAERSVQASAAQGEWGALGDGGGVVDGTVRDILVDGENIYIAGDFTNLANIPEADYIAKWDGTKWSALGGTGWGDGAFNNSIYSLAMIGTDLYAGGTFGGVTNGTTAVTTADFIAKWDGTKWSGLGSDGAGGGALNNIVRDIAASGSNLYVAGLFTDVNNGGTVIPEADYIAMWNGTDWSALGSNGAGNGALNNQALTVAVNNSDVYVGGYFKDVNNLTAADSVAKWDTLAGKWSALGSNGAGNGSLSGIVTSLALSGSDVYVSGYFLNVNNNGAVLTAADYVAKWDGSNWSALGNNGAGNGALNNSTFVLFVNGTDLYVGGYFTDVSNGGTSIPAADYVAKWDGGTWSAVGGNGAGDGSIKSTPVIQAFAMQGGNLLVGGKFYDINNGGTILPQADFLAQWDGANWSTLSMDANGALVNGFSSGEVDSIAVIGTDVYVGGQFTDISNHGLNLPEADYVAKWDGVNWSALGSNGSGDGAVRGKVAALAVMGTDLYVGGTFTDINNNGVPLPTADLIVKWDTLTETWSALNSDGAGNGSLSSGNYVYALAVNGKDLYVGGNFTNVNNGGTFIPEADFLSKWDGINWSALGSNGAGNGALNGPVFAISVSGTGELYVGGGFTEAGAIPEADYIAKWDTLTGNWSALGSNGAGNGALNSPVHTIATSGSDVYAGGTFTNVNNGGTVIPEADFLAKWDALTGNWSALGSNGGGNGSLNFRVNAILVNGADVYVGGVFSNVNNNGTMLTTADHIARWDGSNWYALGSNGSGDGSLSGLNDDVYALLVNGSDLLVGGSFSNVNNNGMMVKEADYLAAYGLDLQPTVTSIVRADSDPTSKKTARFTVTFSEPVLEVDAADFLLTQTGNLSGASITDVSGSGATYTVTVNTGVGDGTLRLDVPAGAVITDATLKPLSELPYTGGEIYTVDRQLIAQSVGTQDGWILESGENTNAGGTMNAAATTLRLGDDMTRKQYRSILSFITSSLPDNAVLTKVSLKLRRQGVIGGGDVVTIFQGLMLDLRKGTFGTAALQPTDWQAAASKTVGPITPTLASGWYIVNLTTSRAYINKLTTSGGLTQIRLRFRLDDNNNVIANFLSLYSGNAGAVSRPQLIVEYYVP